MIISSQIQHDTKKFSLTIELEKEQEVLCTRLKRCKILKWPPFSSGRRPRRPLRPRLKLPTQSQMAEGNLKVPDLKVCVQNAKLFFTRTLEDFFQRYFFDKNVFPDNFLFPKNFSLLSRPLHCIKGICMYLLKFHCKNPEMYKFHCFQDHYILIK